MTISKDNDFTQSHNQEAIILTILTLEKPGEVDFHHLGFFALGQWARGQVSLLPTKTVRLAQHRASKIGRLLVPMASRIQVLF